MKRVHVVGCKNSGKTTLIVDLVRELTGRGYRVGTVKHSSHRHELDVPGKDSHRHRAAGGCPAAAVTETMIAVHFPVGEGRSSYEQLGPYYAGCDLVIVEGGLDSQAPKVEMWRGVLGNPSLAGAHDDIAAVITDDPLDASVPCWPRSDVPLLADKILTLAGTKKD
jgi:molybdopterin-guanine dinucleotide biosynthesis protein B